MGRMKEGWTLNGMTLHTLAHQIAKWLKRLTTEVKYHSERLSFEKYRFFGLKKMPPQVRQPSI